MKPTDLKAGKGQKEAPKQKLKFPVDPKAEPPITVKEALAAPAAICPAHGGYYGGLLGQRGEKEGMVYLCLHPNCKMYRRYTKTLSRERSSSRRAATHSCGQCPDCFGRVLTDVGKLPGLRASRSPLD